MQGHEPLACRKVVMIDTDSELAWIRAAGTGDHRAFERLVGRYQNPVFNFIYRYLGDRYAVVLTRQRQLAHQRAQRVALMLVGVQHQRRPVRVHEAVDRFGRGIDPMAQGEQRVAMGVRIQPDHLAREMGVSRTPVLNALKRLAGEQIVEWVPRRGIYLKTLTKRELARVFEVREALECMAARLAAMRITQEQVDRLAVLFQGIEISSTPDAHALYLERDRELHSQLVMISGNRYLMHAMEAVNVMILTYQYGLNRPMAETMQEHSAILEALRKRDPDASEAAMRLHVGRTRERIDQLADAHAGHRGVELRVRRPDPAQVPHRPVQHGIVAGKAAGLALDSASAFGSVSRPTRSKPA